MNKLTAFCIVFFSTFSFSQEISIQLVAGGFNSPIGLKNAGDSRLFVVERRGIIKIINSDWTVNPTPFLNIDPVVTNNGNEQGLLGLAFHPDYAANGYFYVNYIDNAGNTVVARYSRNTNNPDIADANSGLDVLYIQQPFSNHNGGDMAFGADGYLYIALGDGGSGGDPGNRSQNMQTLLGKMLRIDVDNTNGDNNYAIPADNPYVGSTTELEEIWASGLRNPWRFSFDRETNDIWIADVGQDTYEEINKASLTDAGLNYGWRCYEANQPFNTAGCPPANTLKFPVAFYTHSSSGNFKCSITGGYRYRGTEYPNLYGLYFFADICSNEIGTLEENGNDWNMTFTQPFPSNGWSSFGEDNNGELYITGLNSGAVYKIIDGSLISVEDNTLAAIKLYPNPVEGELTLDFGPEYATISSVTIYTLQGQEIQTFTNVQNQMTKISTKMMSSGLYLVEIKNIKGQKAVHKLLKQ